MVEESKNAGQLRTAGQRRVNLIWELTQASIAILVTLATLTSAMWMAIRGEGNAAFALLGNVFFLVTGFYFGRTNHQKVGGVGVDDTGR